MRVKRIHIEEYGGWRNLDLPISSDNLTVIYGPNEAGKTTLRQFLRDILFGFSADTFLESELAVRSGFLVVEHQGEEYQIARSALGHETGRLQVTGPTQNKSDQAILDEILCGVSAEMFDSVFALGLRELQELATLEGDEVAERVYGTSLGSDGRKIISAGKHAIYSKKQFWNSETQSGTFLKLTERRSDTIRQLRKLGDLQAEYLNLLEEHYSVEARINDQRQLQIGLQSELRGHQFLERIWSPWNREQNLRREYNQLPKLRKLPANALSRFDQFEAERSTLRARRDEIKVELEALKSRVSQSDDLHLLKNNSVTIQSFLDQRGWLAEAERRHSMTGNEVDRLRCEWEEKFQLLGDDWTEERLDTIDISPGVQFQLNDSSRKYLAALGKRSRHRSRYERLSEKTKAKEKQLLDAVKELEIRSLPAGIRETEDRIALLERRAALRIQERELSLRFDLSRQVQNQLHSSQTAQKSPIPEWAHSFLYGFTIFGIILFVAGMTVGISSSWGVSTYHGWLIGAIYALTGITFSSLAWLAQNHFESHGSSQATQLSLVNVNDERQLLVIRQELSRLDPYARFNSGPVLGDAEALQRAHQLLARLLRLQEDDLAIQELRKSLSHSRSQNSKFQSGVAKSRKSWCDLLRRIGFKETLKTKDALSQWQHVYDAYQARENLRRALDSFDYQTEDLNSFQSRIVAFRNQLSSNGNSNDDSLHSLFSQWESDLQGLHQKENDYASLKKRIGELRKEFRSLTDRLNELKRDRSQLLKSARVRSRDELEKLLQSYSRRHALKDELEAAVAELQAISESEPELAVVEEDLLAFDAVKNREHIELLTIELDDLSKDLQQAHATLGRIHRDMEAMEHDRSEVNLRFEKQKTDDEIVHATEEWLGASLAGESVSELRKHYEKTHQPATLKTASRYLSRLTKGNYKTISTSLGENDLKVKHQDQSQFDVQQLSEGTREQLFLSIRFAMIEEMRKKGTMLPILMDDLFVNFDGRRTKAAVHTMIDLAKDAHQIFLFTCHEHLANRFAKKGYKPIVLPDRLEHLAAETTAHQVVSDG